MSYCIAHHKCQTFGDCSIMLVSGIVIVVLVVAGVAVMFAVMQENADVADNVVDVADHGNKRVKEEVVMTSDNATDLQLHSKGGLDVAILEYRVVDDDGTILKTCRAAQDIGASSTEAVALNDCWGGIRNTMKALFLSIMIILAAGIAASAGLADEAFAKQIQVVTARGNVFSLVDSEVGWMNNGTGGGGGGGTTIITNTIIQPSNNSTGAGVGFGYLPQIVIHETPDTWLVWDNGTRTESGSVRPYMREGDLERVTLVGAKHRAIEITLPILAGEYRLQGEDRLDGNNDMRTVNWPPSSWEDASGWLELEGKPGIGGPKTVVVRLNDYPLTNEPANITGWAPPGTTVQIVSSPNDLTQRAIAGDEFAPDIMPLDSYLDYTRTLVTTQYSKNSRLTAGNITTDFLECVEGRSDTYTYRGYRCHNYAYPSYPAVIYTDFYTKDCMDAVDQNTINIGTYRRPAYADVVDGIDVVGHTRGGYSHSPQNPDYSYWTAVSLKTPPVIDCGPKVDGYHHFAGLEQNQTNTYGGTYRFGPLAGTYEGGDFLQEIHGNVTLRTSDHDVHFTGTGFFEETIDLQRTTTVATEVTVTMRLSTSTTSYGYYMLEAPNGQQVTICSFVCRGEITRTLTFDDAPINGEWKVYGKRTISRPGPPLYGWSLTIGTVDFPERVMNPTVVLRSHTTHTLVNTITVPDTGPQTAYRGDLYLMVTGMNATDSTARILASNHDIEGQMVIHGLPPNSPYNVADRRNVLFTGMADRNGDVAVPKNIINPLSLAGPVTFTYWPEAVIYSGNAHARDMGMLFDPYNDKAVEFPWEQDDPLLYVARAYVKLTVPVDGTSIDGVRLVGPLGQVDYPYLEGTYDSGDEVYAPVFPGAREIHLQINGEWVQSYIKDVQQNSQARLINSAAGFGFGNAAITSTATMFATQEGSAIAIVSVTGSGSANQTFITNYAHPSGDDPVIEDPPRRWANARQYCNANDSNNISHYCSRYPGQNAVCRFWSSYAPTVQNGYKAGVLNALRYASNSGAAISVQTYLNGELVPAQQGLEYESGLGLTTSYGGEFGDDGNPRYCAGVNRNTHDGHASLRSSSLWGGHHWVSSEFDRATFTGPIVVNGVVPGDQIDFVVTVGGSTASIPDPMPHWEGRVIQGGFADVRIESGYIILYQ